MRIGIITGASSGMGKEFVKLTMSEQMNLDEIWVIARREERLQAWQKYYKQQTFRGIPMDMQKREDLARLRETLSECCPEIALMIHCAGFGIMGRMDEIPIEEQLEMVDVNCRSLVELTDIVVPYMEEGGRMIYMASASAFIPQPGFAVYAATKSFALSYVRSLRVELRGRNLRITAVCPGAVKTEFFKRACEKKHMPSYKKLVMSDPKKVVQKAWRDNQMGKEISVYGKPMNLFRLAVKIVPHSVILSFMGRQKT